MRITNFQCLVSRTQHVKPSKFSIILFKIKTTLKHGRPSSFKLNQKSNPKLDRANLDLNICIYIAKCLLN